MNKSMYSLILMDELVKALDREAHENGTSRSNLINRILAQHLSMLTPEMRILEVFDHAARIACEGTTLQVQGQPSGSLMVVRGVIKYRYNPAVRYSVELSISDGVYTGEFRVVSRSQSQPLLSRLTVFYELWSQIEHTCLGQNYAGFQLKYSIAGGRYRRTLMALAADENCDCRELGESLGRYIHCFDTALNRYFDASQGVDMETYNAMQTLYSGYLDDTPEVI